MGLSYHWQGNNGDLDLWWCVIPLALNVTDSDADLLEFSNFRISFS